MIRKLVNSKSFLVSFLLIVISIVMPILFLVPNDYWWHYKAGEYIVQNKTIPFIDVFSWYGIENNLYWSSHEWLSEVVYYLVGRFTGNFGVIAFVTLCLMALFFILYKGNKKEYEKNLAFTLIWSIVGFTSFIYLISPRPHMISFIFFALTVYLLYEYRNNENSKKIWLLPLISLLWVNFHGGSSNLPYILTIIFIITGLFEFKFSNITFDKISKKQIKTYFIVGALSFLVLVLNPHGLSMISYPYVNMNDTVMLNLIGEWRSPDIKNFTDIVFILPIVIAVLVFFKSKKEILFIDLVLIGAFSYLSLKSIRFVAFMYIVSSFILFRYLDEEKLINFKFKNVIDLNKYSFYILKRLYLILIGIISVFLILIIPTNPIGDRFNSDIIDKEIIETIKKENPQKLFSHYNYGGYLIYNDIKPLIDGRADMYSGTLLNDYANFTKKLDDKLLEKYDFDYYLIPKDTLIDNYIQSNLDEFEKLIEKDKCILYKKK